MNQCGDAGQYRAYLDGALPEAERVALAAHLEHCQACQQQLAEQQALAARVSLLLSDSEAVPVPGAALTRFHQALDASQTSEAAGAHSQMPVPAVSVSDSRSIPMRRMSSLWSGPRRALFTGLAVLLALVSLLAFPPVRAAADQLLQVFRVQSVVFVPVDRERIEELQNLDFDKESLLVGEPELLNEPSEPRAVASAQEAADAVGFSLSEPAQLPSEATATEYYVTDRTVARFQVDVESLRQLLALADVNDVTLPDALGAESITVDMPQGAAVSYSGEGYTLNLYQGRSPSVALPDGVNLEQLGVAVLRLLGMDLDAAQAMSSQIDWSSTLVFPIPADINDVRQVTVGGAPGLLVGAGDDSQRWVLYWQRGEQVYVLQAEGITRAAELLATAETIR